MRLQRIDIARALGDQLEQVVLRPLERPRDLRQRQYAVLFFSDVKDLFDCVDILEHLQQGAYGGFFRPPVVLT
ncbi:MAG: hypothetical protein ACXV5H_07355 [Halobacteriota archaeon]